MRNDIANAIEQCYDDVHNPTLNTEAIQAAVQAKIDAGEMAALTIGDHTITSAKLAQGVFDDTLTTPGAAADAKKTGDEIAAINESLQEYADIFTADVDTSVQNWLTQHPEATTTVQDGSLTEAKFSNALKLKTIKDYVTPEMFGAVGDGVTDDTQAWQSAVNAGLPVKATNKLYKCGQINITKNISIDCNGADFVCTGNRLFYCMGEVVTTLTGENDYIANDIDYAISSVGYTDYSGFAMIKGTNNFMPVRDYYKGGFVCKFDNGKITSNYPIGVSGVTIELVNPITVDICNIGNISHNYNGYTFSIVVEYGLNCKIHDINGKYSSYTVLSLDKCLDCFAENLNIKNDYTGQSYIVVFANSSYCEVSRSSLHNREWHAVTTGDIYLCYKNKVKDCVLTSTIHYAYVDHHNGLGTIIEDCTVSTLVATGLCLLKNLTITPNNTGVADIRLAGCPLSENAIYDISDIVFDVDNTLANNSSNGIGIFAGAEQVTGETFYVNNVFIKNCKSANSGKICYNVSVASTDTLIIENVTLDNFQGYVYGGKSNNIDISNYMLTIRNVQQNLYIGASASMEYNVVVIENSKMYMIRGIFNELRFSMIEVYAQIKDITVNGKLIGDMLIGYIPNAQLLIPTRLSIGMISVNDNYTYFNYVNDNNGNKYYSSYVNGTLTVTQIA